MLYKVNCDTVTRKRNTLNLFIVFEKASSNELLCSLFNRFDFEISVPFGRSILCVSFCVFNFLCVSFCV